MKKSKKALFTSVNLLGDTVLITPALEAWSKKYPECSIEVRTQYQEFTKFLKGDYPFGKIVNIPGDFGKITAPSEEERAKFNYFHNFDISAAHAYATRKNIHITEAYGSQIGVEVTKKYPILPAIWPVAFKQRPYVCVAPFAGYFKYSPPDGGSERAMTFATWKEIITYLLDSGIMVLIIGYPESPWEAFKKYMPTDRDLHYLSEGSLKLTLEIIMADFCKGFICQNSGLMHCVSGLVPQLKRKNYSVFCIMTNVCSLALHYPWGIPEEQLIIKRGYCNRIKFTDLQEELEKFKGMTTL